MNRIINFAKAEVRCPYWNADVDIIGDKGCLPPPNESCQYLEKINVAVVCTWTEQDGYGDSLQGEVDCDG